MFLTFDTEPLGAASLAQVHRATLKNGAEVAVKVQHHYVRGNAKVDTATMEYCVKIMGWLFPEFRFQWLVDESKKNLPIELDFLHEGKNVEKVSAKNDFIKFSLIAHYFSGSSAIQARELAQNTENLLGVINRSSTCDGIFRRRTSQ